MMENILWLAAGSGLLVTAALLCSRYMIEFGGRWQHQEGRALLRIRWEAAGLEGFGRLSARERAIGLRLKERTLWQMPTARLEKRIAGFVSKAMTDRRERFDPAGLWNKIRAQYAPARQLVGSFSRPAVALKGTFGFEDPAFTGWAAGVVYTTEACLRETVHCLQWDLHPNFVEPTHDIQSSVSFSIRPYRLLGPGLRLLWGLLTEVRAASD